MKTDDVKRTQNQSVKKTTQNSHALHNLPQVSQRRGNTGPNKIHHKTYRNENKGVDDRNKTASAEKGQKLREFDFIKTIVHKRSDDTGDDAAEDVHV